MNEHEWRRNRCECGAWRHFTTPAHPRFPERWLYSFDGENWSPIKPAHVPAAPEEKP